MPTISMTGGTVIEQFSNFIEFVVTLSEPSLDAITVNFRTLRGTAQDSDLDATTTGSQHNGVITFGVGQTTASIFIEAGSDSIDEVDEDITVELFNPSAAASFANDLPVVRATGIILDNDGAGSNLALFVGDPVITEGDSGQKFAVFQITLSQPAPSGFTASYATSDITAIAGEDYTATSGSISFASGQTTTTVSVPVLGDTLAEGAEHFALTVTPPSSPLIATTGATGQATILDTDTSTLPEISIEGDVVQESFSNFIRFTVTLSEPSLDAVTVDYRTLRGTAQDSDLDATTTGSQHNGTITFAPGQTTTSIFIEAGSDSIDEFDENIVVELFNPSATAVFGEDLPVLRATGVVLDNDGPGSNLALFVADPVITEGDSGQKMAVFEITLSQPAPAAFTATYATFDGTAVAGEDYAASSGSVTFAAGQTTAAVAVEVFGDTLAEAAEHFSLSVTPPNSPLIATAGAVGEATILDTDVPGLPQVSVEGGVVEESFSNFIRFVVTLSEPSLDAVTVDYRTLRGTAQDSDLDATTTSGQHNGTITFAPGQTSASIFIEAGSDSIDEVDEDITLELYNTSATATFGEDVPVLRATGVILDNDGPGSNLAMLVGDPFLTEGDSGEKLAVFEIVLSQPAPAGFTATYATSDITALAGEDYAAMSGDIVFAAGQTTAFVSVPVFGDTLAEGAEHFALTVTPPPSPLINVLGATGEATIVDTDTSSGLPEISIEGDVVQESFSNFVRFVVTLSEASATPVSVDFQSFGGTVISTDVDNGFETGTLTFGAGQTSLSIFIEADSDSLDERDETVFIRLTDPVGAEFAENVGTLYAEGFVLDNDGVGPNRAVAATPAEIFETGQSSSVHFIEVSLSQPSSVELTFDASLLSGTATVGADVTLIDTTVTFAPGQTTAAVRVQVEGDSDNQEGPENFEILLAPASGTPFVGIIENTTITIADGNNYVAPTKNADDLQGSNRSDLINLRGGDDTLSALGGDDTVITGPGNDLVNGGKGVDTADYSTFSGVQAYLSFGQVRTSVGNDTLINFENIIGSSSNDRLIGSNGANDLMGGDGDDIIKTREGGDTADGGAGNDTVKGGGDDDMLSGGADDDVIAGSAGNDTIYGNDGDDNLNGNSDDDLMSGGGGEDKLQGGKGDDMIEGGDDQDRLFGDRGNDTLYGDDGDDFLFGGANGEDVLHGGAGDDRMTGGSQSDTFIFDLGDGNDRIKDWEDGTDVVDLAGFGFTSFAQVEALANQLSGGVRLEFGTGETLLFEGIDESALSADDFILS